MTQKIESLARKIRDTINNPKRCDWEVYISESRGMSLSWSEGSLEEKLFAQDGGMGVRLLSGGRQGFASANTLDPGGFFHLWEQAESMLEHTPKDPLRSLPEPSAVPEGDVETFDPVIDRMDTAGIESMLADLEKKLLRVDPRIKKAYKIEWGLGSSRSVIMNSRGLFAGKAGTSCSAGIECVAEDAGETQVGSFSLGKRFLEDLCLDGLPLQAAQIALDQLGGQPVPSGRMSVVVEPWVMMEFLELIGGSVCADNVQKGKSLFKGKRGTPVASSLVTLVDDARMKRGIGSSLLDDEGIPTGTHRVIENGVLKMFLYDTYTARKDGVSSTGNASRPSFRGFPEPGLSNWILLPGKTAREEIIGTTDRGLRIINVMGMHTADPISGDFSLGAVGTLIEKGKLTRPVRGVTIAGNILDLLKHIDAVGDDPLTLGTTISPTVRIGNVMIGGS